MKYRTKSIRSGDLLELEIYPIIETKGGKRRIRINSTGAAQEKINKRNKEKQLLRKIYANFGVNDYFVTLTFKEQIDEAAAKKSMKNYLRRLRRRYEKENKELKYIYVLERGNNRIHFHLIVNNGVAAEVIIKEWKEGFSKISGLRKDFEGLVKYLLKEEREQNERNWSSSKNLKEPKITTNDSKFSRKRVEQMRDKLNLFSIVGKLYPNYTYSDSFVKDGVFIDGVYCYIKLFAAKT